MTTLRPALELSDLERLRDAEAPDFTSELQAFLAQPDRQPEPEALAQHAGPVMTLVQLREALRWARGRRPKAQRIRLATESWHRYLSQPLSLRDPKLGLAELIEGLYAQRDSAFAREVLLTCAREAELELGLWGGLKRVYKRTERDHDYPLLGALAARFDVAASLGQGKAVGRGTLIYLRRRAGRTLRQLGKAAPELYPQAVVEVLRSYPSGSQAWSCPLAAELTAGRSKKWGAPVGLARDKQFRPPYLESFRQSAEPLERLLATCEADFVAEFAIRGLRELFADALRSPRPGWLALVAARPSPLAHTFVVELLEATPSLAPARFEELGLHEAVLGLLLSASDKARHYAIEYARARPAQLSSPFLAGLLEPDAGAPGDTVALAVALLGSRPARELGVRVLGKLLGHEAAHHWAAAALEQEFAPHELDVPFLVDLLFSPGQRTWARKYISRRRDAFGAAPWLAVLDDPRFRHAHRTVGQVALDALRRVPMESIPGDWLLGALVRDDLGDRLASWLERAEALPPTLDRERLKALVLDPSHRKVALSVLGNAKLVTPDELGVDWLLALARHSDPTLHDWAHAYLLRNLGPEHFAEGEKDGIARLFALALGPKQPEAVRTFAQTYLRCHHPALFRDQPEARALELTPRVGRGAYTFERLWPALSDLRPDVRRFAVAIARVELRRWRAHTRVYELAESAAKEVRNLAYDALTQAGEPHAEEGLALRPEELDAAQIFTLTESRKPSTRSVALALIRKHYARIGGIDRLGWLMQSADREVRLFAVRLLWERHRPRGIPAGWQPKGGTLESDEVFADMEALRGLLRRMLFTLPPGRAAEPLERVRAGKLPASVAKRRVIELVRDFGLGDAAFAALVAPVLAEFSGSLARGEWQASLSALMTLRAAHGLVLEEVGT